MNPTKGSSLTASSEAIFGSSARGDNDRMSDRDILIVDDDIEILRARSKALTEAGWSVASYTFSKLDALASRGALFVQHLKLESSIVVDVDDRLAKNLERFRPRLDYAEEIRDNERLASLAGVVPDTPIGPLLSADILYVTVRNFGVLKLAELGTHVYAYDKIVEELERFEVISPGSARHLFALRFLKCLYRSGETAAGHRAKHTVSKALDVLPSDHFPKTLTVVDASSLLMAAGPPRPCPAYLQLRDLERRYVALQSLGITKDQTAQFEKLSQWIRNPRAYAFLSDRLAPQLRSEMRKIAELLIPESHSLIGRPAKASILK